MPLPPQDAPAGLIRQLRPSDAPRFRDHLQRLDTTARHDRFNGGIDDGFLERYAERCFGDGTTVIGCVIADRVVAAAELHERPEFECPTGEAAFSVEHAHRRRGLGSRLFERLLLHARALGYDRLLVTTHADNGAMKALARKYDAQLEFDVGEAHGIIELAGVGPAGSAWASDHAVDGLAELPRL